MKKRMIYVVLALALILSINMALAYPESDCSAIKTEIDAALAPLLSLVYGDCTPLYNSWEVYDFNNDGVVDGRDYGVAEDYDIINGVSDDCTPILNTNSVCASFDTEPNPCPRFAAMVSSILSNFGSVSCTGGIPDNAYGHYLDANNDGFIDINDFNYFNSNPADNCASVLDGSSQTYPTGIVCPGYDITPFQGDCYSRSMDMASMIPPFDFLPILSSSCTNPIYMNNEEYDANDDDAIDGADETIWGNLASEVIGCNLQEIQSLITECAITMPDNCQEWWDETDYLFNVLNLGVDVTCPFGANFDLNANGDMVINQLDLNLIATYFPDTCGPIRAAVSDTCPVIDDCQDWWNDIEAAMFDGDKFCGDLKYGYDLDVDSDQDVDNVDLVTVNLRIGDNDCTPDRLALADPCPVTDSCQIWHDDVSFYLGTTIFPDIRRDCSEGLDPDMDPNQDGFTDNNDLIYLNTLIGTDSCGPLRASVLDYCTYIDAPGRECEYIIYNANRITLDYGASGVPCGHVEFLSQVDFDRDLDNDVDDGTLAQTLHDSSELCPEDDSYLGCLGGFNNCYTIRTALLNFKSDPGFPIGCNTESPPTVFPYDLVFDVDDGPTGPGHGDGQLGDLDIFAVNQRLIVGGALADCTDYWTNLFDWCTVAPGTIYIADMDGNRFADGAKINYGDSVRLIGAGGDPPSRRLVTSGGEINFVVPDAEIYSFTEPIWQTYLDLYKDKYIYFTTFSGPAENYVFLESNEVNTPTELIVTNPDCGDVFDITGGGSVLVTIDGTTVDPDDYVTVKIFIDDELVHTDSDGDSSYIFVHSFTSPGSYSIKVKTETPRGEEQTEYANIIVYDTNNEGEEYAAACVKVKKPFPTNPSIIYFDGSGSVGARITGGALGIISDLLLNWYWALYPDGSPYPVTCSGVGSGACEGDNHPNANRTAFMAVMPTGSGNSVFLEVSV